MKRAFSMIEVFVVVVIIGIAGTLALQALAASVRGARAASERTALVLRVREQRRHQVERLQGLTITTPAPDRIVFSNALLTRTNGVITSCDQGDAIRTDTYTALALSTTTNAPKPPPLVSSPSSVTPPTAATSLVCFDEAGHPVDTDIALTVDADTNGDGGFDAGEGGTLGWSPLGTLFGTGAIVGTVVGASSNVEADASLANGRGAESVTPIAVN